MTDLLVKEILSMMDTEQQNIFIDVCRICIGRPDLQRYALDYTGDLRELPAVLMSMVK